MAEKLSLIMPIMDPASLNALKVDLELQKRRPDELIFVNAGLGEFPDLSGWNADAIKVISARGARPGAARNLGISASSGTLLVFIDEGCRLFPDTLREFEKSSKGFEGVIWGYEFPVLMSPVEEASYLIFSGALSRFLYKLGRRKGFSYTRGMAIKRELIDQLGGFPAWLRAGEDGLFCERIETGSVKTRFAEKALIGWRPRSSLLETAIQYYVYGRGDARAHVHRNIQRIKGLIYSSILGLAIFRKKEISAALFGAYLLAVVSLAFLGGARIIRPLSCLFSPVLLLVKDLSSLAGYAIGVRSTGTEMQLIRRKQRYLRGRG